MRRLFRLSSSCLLARTIRNKGKGHNRIRDISTAKKKSFLKVEKWPVVNLKQKVVNILFTRLFRTWRVNFNLWTDGTRTAINSSWGRSTLLLFVLRFTCLHVRLYRILLYSCKQVLANEALLLRSVKAWFLRPSKTTPLLLKTQTNAAARSVICSNRKCFLLLRSISVMCTR